MTQREAGIERDGLPVVANCLVRLLCRELTEPEHALNPSVVLIQIGGPLRQLSCLGEPGKRITTPAKYDAADQAIGKKCENRYVVGIELEAFSKHSLRLGVVLLGRSSEPLAWRNT